MKIDFEEKRDRYGNYSFCRVSGKDAYPQKIHEKLYNNGYGYKFVMVFDCTCDELGDLDNETPIYYMDTLANEFLEYIGVDVVKNWLVGKGK